MEGLLCPPLGAGLHIGDGEMSHLRLQPHVAAQVAQWRGLATRWLHRDEDDAMAEDSW